MKRKTHFTDGEGPIVFKDLAADITGGINFHRPINFPREEVPGHKFTGV